MDVSFNGPRLCNVAANGLIEVTMTSSMVTDRVRRPHSASTKQRTLRSGGLAPVTWATVLPCRAIPESRSVRLRPLTKSAGWRLNHPPTWRRSTRPLYRFVSMIHTPEGTIAMWSMLARLPGMERSCRMTPLARRARLKKAPTLSSPCPPRSQARVEGASPVMPLTSDASRRPNLCLRRMSSQARRRSNSARAEAPAVPRSSPFPGSPLSGPRIPTFPPSAESAP